MAPTNCSRLDSQFRHISYTRTKLANLDETNHGEYPETDTMAEGNPPFIRNLASSGSSPSPSLPFPSLPSLPLRPEKANTPNSPDLKLRTAALTSLRTFLTPRDLSRTEALKLWSGLFYALWMSDRPLPQQSLAASLADLQLTSLRPPSAATWMSAFWEVVSSKWTSIDVLRMEKFLLLVRRVFGAGVRWVMEGEKGEERKEVFLGVLKDWPFGEREGEVPLGLRLHVVDIWVDELERAGALESKDEGVKALVEGMGEVVRGVTTGVPSKPLRERAKESLEDERLPWYEAPEAEEEDAGWEGFGD